MLIRLNNYPVRQSGSAKIFKMTAFLRAGHTLSMISLLSLRRYC